MKVKARAVGWKNLTSKLSSTTLRGTTLDIYYFMLKKGKPVGVRDLQRGLNLSSHSVARYHLSKLENVGLVKYEGGNYFITKILLENNVKIHRFVIPRFLFYAILAIILLIVEFSLLGSTAVNCTVYCYTIATFILFVVIFCAETIRVWLKGSL